MSPILLCERHLAATDKDWLLEAAHTNRRLSFLNRYGCNGQTFSKKPGFMFILNNINVIINRARGLPGERAAGR
jgi:hypothetical protein